MPSIEPPQHFASISFFELFTALLPKSVFDMTIKAFGPAQRRPAEVPLFDIVAALVFHVQNAMGSLEDHLEDLFGHKVSASAITQRRKILDWNIFRVILNSVLSPIADERKHPGSFFKSWRLVAGDGTNFSLQNTPAILGSVPKVQSRRFKAAFAKLGLWMMVEVGVHNPLAAGIGCGPKCSEAALADEVIDRLPDGSLMLLDRYYGNGAFLKRFVSVNQNKRLAFLVRVREGANAPKLKGTCPLGDRTVIGHLASEDGPIQVREVILKLKRQGCEKWSRVRLWTSLIDPQEASVEELAKLYAKRWEIEVFYKEMKIDMRTTTLLQSHSEETAKQEVAAIVLAAAMLAAQRLEAAERAEVEPTRISFALVLESIVTIWTLLSLTQSEQEQEVIVTLWKRQLDKVASRALPERRKRTCGRTVRQPIQKWPRTIEPTSVTGEIEIELAIS